MIPAESFSDVIRFAQRILAEKQQQGREEEEESTGGGRPNGGQRLFDSAFVEKTAGTRVLIDGQQKKRV